MAEKELSLFKGKLEEQRKLIAKVMHRIKWAFTHGQLAQINKRFTLHNFRLLLKQNISKYIIVNITEVNINSLHFRDSWGKLAYNKQIQLLPPG